AALIGRRDTFFMAVPNKRGPLLLASLALAFCAFALPAQADEIRLKGGRKLYGVIVAYEDNMFKIKTDFGYELIEKDKIESIIPSTPAGKTETPAGAKKSATLPKTEGGAPTPQTEPAVAKPADAGAAATNASAKSVNPSLAGKADKASPKITNAAAKPEVPANTTASNATAPAIKGSPAATASAPSAAPATSPASQKEPEVPANREEIQGNLYTNYTHGFRMYKAPSWSLIEDARKALPNAIVAMGTSNESTLMVVGQEQTKDSLEASANGVEKRLREIYSNYRMISRRKTVVGGAPAIEFKYSGMADEHLWSGTLVVVSRGKDVLTLLGMTYADNDLIQIQENVIA